MQAEVELILLRQLATYLNIPMLLIGMDGELLFYNDAAAVLVGRPFDDAGEEMRQEALASTFRVTTEGGSPAKEEDLPITIALKHRRPAHSRLSGQALDGVRRTIELTAFPIDGLAGRQLGAVAIFWEAGE